MDLVSVRDLNVQAVIGVHAWERGITQTLVIDVVMAAEVARAARFYMSNQVEAGHNCPITMTRAAVAALAAAPELREGRGSVPRNRNPRAWPIPTCRR